MHIQEKARNTISPRIPRYFWYSLAFAVVYLVIFGSWIVVNKDLSSLFTLRETSGILLAALLSFGLSWVGVRRHQWKQDTSSPHLSAQRRLTFWVPLMFSIALAFAVVGDSIYVYNYWHMVLTWPTWADAAMLMMYPALLTGLLLLPRSVLLGHAPLRFVLDSLMVIATLVAFSWYFTLGPTLLRGTGGSLVFMLASIAYPAFDLLLISSTFLFTTRIPDKRLRMAIRILSAALAILAISDSYATYTVLQNTYTSGLMDLGWAIGCFGIALSIQAMRWLSGRKAADETPPQEPSSFATAPIWRSLLPYALVPALIGLVLYVWKRDQADPLAVGTYMCGLVLLVLIFVKQFVSVREIHLLNRGLRSTQHILHEKNTALEQANARLDALATTDVLTNLPNHRGLQTLLEQECERARRFGRPLSLLFLDGDRFKQINDTYGHAAGDTVLRELGERARSVLRAGDTVGRFGGEEFLMLLPETGAQEAQVVAERLRSAVAACSLAAREVEGGIAVTVSIGLGSYPTDGATASEILEQADQAMYWAKRLGRNQVRTAAEAARANLDAELKAATAHALERPELATLDRQDQERWVRAEQLGLIYSLMGALDLREPGMSEHAHEVSDLVTAMARALEFDEARTRRAAMAAFLHDIGKIALPDRLLHQLRQHFSAQEWRLLHQHAALGADIVEASPWLADLAPAIRHHHEHWDGTGDPDGLAGEAIPLEARLIGVAEAYHAMISEQPYQAARSVADALDELERRAGTQFDPALVPVLLAVLQSRQEGRDPSPERARPDLLTQV